MKSREHPRQERRDNPHKQYVEVIVHNTTDGLLIPVKFRTEQGHKFIVDRLITSEPCASQKAGGAGYRYTCAVTVGAEDQYYVKEIALFHDTDFWFVEEDQLQTLFTC